jgi:predicted O-methyltransferase YrrM
VSGASRFADAWAAARDIEGWLSEDQARALFEAAAAVQPGRSIVEIGSHRGRSTIVLARAARDGVEIVAVDPFDDLRWGGGAESYDVFLENVRRAGVDGRVRVVRGTSESAARDWNGPPIGLVYVDGAHDRRSVLADIDGWARWLENDGLILLHDAFSSVGVTAAVLQRFLLRGGFSYVRSVRSLVVLRKRSASPAAAVGLSARLLARLPYFARNVAVKVALRRGWHGACRVLGHADTHAPY